MDTLLAHGVTPGGSNTEIAICHDTYLWSISLAIRSADATETPCDTLFEGVGNAL